MISRHSPGSQLLIPIAFLQLSQTDAERIETTLDSSSLGNSILCCESNRSPLNTCAADFAAATTQTGRVNPLKSTKEENTRQICLIVF